MSKKTIIERSNKKKKIKENVKGTYDASNFVSFFLNLNINVSEERAYAGNRRSVTEGRTIAPDRPALDQEDLDS